MGNAGHVFLHFDREPGSESQRALAWPKACLARTSYTTRGWARTLTSGIWEPEFGDVGAKQIPHFRVQLLHSSRGTFLPCRAASATRAHLVRLVLEE
jgi:hypothetical protein